MPTLTQLNEFETHRPTLSMQYHGEHYGRALQAALTFGVGEDAPEFEDAYTVTDVSAQYEERGETPDFTHTVQIDGPGYTFTLCYRTFDGQRGWFSTGDREALTDVACPGCNGKIKPHKPWK